MTVRQCLDQSPTKSTRRLSQEIDLRSSVMRIMHQDLHLLPYKIQILQLQSMEIIVRDVPLGKPPVSQSKTVLISWISFFSVTRQISSLVVTWINRMEQHRIAVMLHSSSSIVTSLNTGSSSVVRTSLGLHILQTSPLWTIFCGGT